MTSTSTTSLGALFHPFQDEQRENPYPFYEQLRSEEPIAYSPELDAWLVTRYSDLRAILSQPEVFSSRHVTRPVSNITPATREILAQGYPMTSTAISSDGKTHERFRAPYAKTFAPPRVAEHRGFVYRTVQRLIDEIAPDGRADLIGRFAYPLTVEVVLHVMGVPEERMADAKAWSRALIAFLYAPLAEEQQVQCARGLVDFQRYIAGLIENRRQSPREDAISDMVHSRLPDAEPLSLNEMVSALCGLLMAGHKTTIDLIGNGLALLLNPAERWERLVARPDLIPSAVEEILRYDGPVQALSRTTTREVTVGDVTLPAGANLLVICGSGNRDETQYPQAEVFDMERNPARHLAFGHGSHFCVGAPLARLMGQTVFEIFTRRLPTLHLVPGQQLVNVPALQFRGYQRLEVAW